MTTIIADEGLLRVTVTVPAGTRWQAFTSQILAAVGRSPKLSNYDWIIDDQGPMDDVELSGMTLTGEAFRAAGEGSRPTSTVVVTNDRYFSTWAEVMDHHHLRRRHYGASTLAEAVELLDRLNSAG